MDGEIISGPWRATRLWNDIVRNFHSGITLKKHRRHMKTHDNCFSGIEAVDFLYKHLKRNPNFETDVTKDQIIQLLNKIILAGFIENVESSRDEVYESQEFSIGALYRFVDDSIDNLKTPCKSSSELLKGNNSHEKRKILSNMSNSSPFKSLKNTLSSKTPLKQIDPEKWESKSEFSGLQLLKKKKSSKFPPSQLKEDLNRSYFQSLPSNSLITLDNEKTWKLTYISQLSSCLSNIHVESLNMNTSNIIYNMTKVSARGIVQLTEKDRFDLPHWVLSAMKCLANWPKPMKMVNGHDSTLPNYPSFINDVFRVVKDYFSGLGSPLIPYELFDIFISAHVKAEAIGARINRRPLHQTSHASTNSFLPLPSSSSMQTSTPTYSGFTNRPNFYVMSESLSEEIVLSNSERMAIVRNTFDVRPPVGSTASIVSYSPLSNFDASNSNGSFSYGEDFPQPLTNLNSEMSTTAIMKNFLPPNSCFETAFMDEKPVTRIVPQKETDSVYGQNYRSLSRISKKPQSFDTKSICSFKNITIQNNDTRSISTQTGAENEISTLQKKNTKWKKSNRQRKSIAVMEHGKNKGVVNQAFQMSPNSKLFYGVVNKKNNGCFVKKGYSSLDNLLDNDILNEDEIFLEKYLKMSENLETRISNFDEDNCIPSKTVRKEKKKQRNKRERSYSVDRINSRTSTIRDGRYVDPVIDRNNPFENKKDIYYYQTSKYNNLTVKTPINVIPQPVFMSNHAMKAVPCRTIIEDEPLSPDGARSAIDSFKLLGLLLPPANRRKLQLLLKFMKRVSANSELILSHTNQSNFDMVLDTFTASIIKADGHSGYDEELCRKITKFFVLNYDSIWKPPDSLRKEVEEKVYQLLVSKRINEREDSFPVTYCERMSTHQFENAGNLAVNNAMRDLLEQMLSCTKLSVKDKKKKLRKFKDAYPKIYREKFPSDDDEPEFMKKKHINISGAGKMSSLSKIKQAIRI